MVGSRQSLFPAKLAVGVFAAPMIPGINDHELPAILEAARGTGRGLRCIFTLGTRCGP